MKELTEKEMQIYQYIKKQIKINSIPPTIREICSATDLSSTATVHMYLEKLESKGYINRSFARTRHIKILEDNFYANNDSKNVAAVPIVGVVAAGNPILAEENIEGYFPVPVDYLKNNKAFMLRISGDSMIDAGILDKDLVLVNRQSYAENNNIIIALLEDGATCKRFFKENGFIRLQPENSEYAPIITKEVIILGKVIGLFRSY